tara:strand:- start:1828 stop:2244 length:417 start_codon:yes stop_codon:yes gene_type:complete
MESSMATVAWRYPYLLLSAPYMRGIGREVSGKGGVPIGTVKANYTLVNGVITKGMVPGLIFSISLAGKRTSIQNFGSRIILRIILAILLKTIFRGRGLTVGQMVRGMRGVFLLAISMAKELFITQLEPLGNNFGIMVT